MTRLLMSTTDTQPSDKTNNEGESMANTPSSANVGKSPGAPLSYETSSDGETELYYDDLAALKRWPE